MQRSLGTALGCFVVWFALASGVVVAQSPTPEPTPQTLIGDRVISGMMFRLRQGESLRGNLLLYSGEAAVERGAEVLGSVVVFGGRFDLEGEVMGNIVVLGGEAKLGDTAIVAGQVTRLGGSLTQAPGARILGNVFALPFAREGSPSPMPQPRVDEGWMSQFLGRMSNSLLAAGAILLGIVTITLLATTIAALALEPLMRAGQAVINAFWISLGLGALTLIVVPVVVVALAITLCLIPLALVLALAYAIAIVLGWVVSAHLLGERLVQAIGRGALPLVAQVALGALVLAVLGNTPVIGWLIGFLAASVGVGALILTRLGTQAYAPPSPPSALSVPDAPVAP
ncbi:MAG: hypothetical protein NZL91_09075 [Thermoflexales bacterium]|nr:hypothetical protein [Thermoflexales bacterium]